MKKKGCRDSLNRILVIFLGPKYHTIYWQFKIYLKGKGKSKYVIDYVIDYFVK